MSDEVAFESTVGKWDGNSLIIDKEVKVDSVKVTAYVKKQPEIKRSIVIYVKKIEVEPPLKSEQELLDEWQKKSKRKKDKKDFKV
jgi:phage regulator Rha-like protein